MPISKSCVRWDMDFWQVFVWISNRAIEACRRQADCIPDKNFSPGPDQWGRAHFCSLVVLHWNNFVKLFSASTLSIFIMAVCPLWHCFFIRYMQRWISVGSQNSRLLFFYFLSWMWNYSCHGRWVTWRWRQCLVFSYIQVRVRCCLNYQIQAFITVYRLA